MFQAIVRVQSEAAQIWIALWQEIWTRAAAARDPAGLVAIPFLTFPELASQASLYSKRLLDTTVPHYASGGKAPEAAAASPATTNAPDSATVVAGIGLPVAAASSLSAESKTIKQSTSAKPFRGE
jgi:hypothetical protein